MKEITVKLSDKAEQLLEIFKKNSGLESDDAVIQEVMFTVHECLSLAYGRPKTSETISADRFLGVLSTFTRFMDTRYDEAYKL